MSFTKIAAAGIGSTETVTLHSLEVLNNATIGGVLTYEDVTNVDSIGIITARAGVLVGSGITLSKDGDIFATGVTTATSFVGALTGNVSGGTVAGSTGTFTGDVDIADKIIHSGDTNTAIRFPAADTVTVETAGSERARIDSSGRLLIGHTATTSKDRQVQLVGTTADGSSYMALRHSADANGSRLDLCKSRNATPGSNTIVVDDDVLGSIDFLGDDGTDIQSVGASIVAQVDGTPGSNDMPGRLIFRTTADGAAASTERLRIASDGVITAQKSATFGNTSDSFTAVQITSSTSGISELRFGDTTANAGYIKYSHSSNILEFATSATSRANIASDGKLSIDRTHASATTGNHPALDIDTIAAGTAGASFATGIDFRVAGVHKKRLVVTNTDSSAGTGDWIFYRDQGNNIGMKLSAAGYLTKPQTPAFAVGMTASRLAVQGWQTIQFDDEHFDNGDHFNSSSHRFVAPVAGYYQFNLVQRVDAGGGGGNYYRIVFRKNNSTGTTYDHGMAILRDDDGFSFNSMSLSCVIYCAATDYVDTAFYAHTVSGLSTYMQRESVFSGHLIG